MSRTSILHFGECLSLAYSSIDFPKWVFRFLMAQWFRRVSQGHEIYCPWPRGHQLEPWLGQTWLCKPCLNQTFLVLHHHHHRRRRCSSNNCNYNNNKQQQQQQQQKQKQTPPNVCMPRGIPVSFLSLLKLLQLLMPNTVLSSCVCWGVCTMSCIRQTNVLLS